MTSTKRFLSFVMATALVTPVLLTSCSEDEPDNKYVEMNLDIAKADLSFNTDDVWTGWDKDSPLRIGDFTLSHGWDGYPFGFTAAKISDTQNYPGLMTDHQFAVMPGGGANGTGTPYIVGYWDSYQETAGAQISYTCEINLTDNEGNPQAFYPQSIKVTNTCYTYYTMLEGNNFAKKFDEGDWLRLNVIARTVAGGTETCSFYLADCKGTDKSKWFVTDWKTFDLSKLGKVYNLVFQIASSDTGTYGINTPTYFAIDDLRTLIEK